VVINRREENHKETKNRKAFICSLCSLSLCGFLLLAATVSAQQSPREIYERARMLEEINQIQEAIKLYNQVVGQAKDQRALAASAQYRVGMLYERLGRKAEALQAFRVVASKYIDQMDVARRAQARIAAAGPDDRAMAGIAIKRGGPSPDSPYLASYTFSAKQFPSRPVLDPVRNRLYVNVQQITEQSADNNQDPKQQSRPRQVYESSRLFVIDTNTNSIVKTLPFSVYLNDIEFNPSNNRLYATAQLNGHVKIIDINSFKETRIAVPGYPTNIAINPITNKIYIDSQGFGGNDKLFVIDGATDALTGPFDLAGTAGGIIVNSATNRVYASVSNRTKVRVFDGADNSILTDLPDLFVIESDPVYNRIYTRMLDSNSNSTLQALDGETHSVIADYRFAGTINIAAINPDVNRLYVLLDQKNQIAVIDTRTDTELGRLSTGKNPFDLTLDKKIGQMYVCHRTSNSIGLLENSALSEEVPEEFFDSFDSPTLDPDWTVLKGESKFSLTDNPGKLRCRVAITTGSNSHSLFIRKFRGDFWTLDIKATYFTSTTGGSRHLYFKIVFGNAPSPVVQLINNGIQIGRLREDWDGCCPGQTKQTFYENGANSLESLLPPNPNESYYWRIKRNGRRVSIERSDDGSNFTLVGTHTFGSQIDNTIQFLCISYNTHNNRDAYADYDFMRLTKER
jgi:DNA-binding beta-propeller fold protein YncE